MCKERKEEDAVIIYTYTIRCKECGWTHTFYCENDIPPEEIFCPLCLKMKTIKMRKKS